MITSLNETKHVALALLKKQEVAQRLQVTTRTVENLIAAGKLPVIQLTKRCVRFSWPDVEAALAARRVN